LHSLIQRPRFSSKVARLRDRRWPKRRQRNVIADNTSTTEGDDPWGNDLLRRWLRELQFRFCAVPFRGAQRCASGPRSSSRFIRAAISLRWTPA
jgi:hypothetical protein